MCLILFAFHPDAEIPLIVAANRDEFHAREAAAAAFWSDDENILAGRDLVAGGSWLGCTQTGRFAALTNFSSPEDPLAPKSRGELVHGFLANNDSAEHYAHHLTGHDYAGFNLLLYDGEQLVYTSNRGVTEILKPGYWGLSNAEFGATWPKCIDGARGLRDILTRTHSDEDLLEMLADTSVPSDDTLPHRGRPIETERRIAPRFIDGDEYGTRASTILKLGRRRAHFVEQTYGPNAEMGGRVSFDFELTSA